jgi:lipopolysaccharide export LptBFGC system permease protein LptF
MSNSYYAAEFVRDYGLWLFVIIFGWTLLAAYFSSGLTTWEVSPLKLTISGIIICLLLCISASIIAFLTVDGIVWGMSDSAQH